MFDTNLSFLFTQRFWYVVVGGGNGDDGGDGGDGGDNGDGGDGDDNGDSGDGGGGDNGDGGDSCDGDCSVIVFGVSGVVGFCAGVCVSGRVGIDRRFSHFDGWKFSTLYIYLNVVCCVGRVEIQIEIQKGRRTANTDSMV